MFHHATTLHHRTQNNFAFGKEKRLVYKGLPKLPDLKLGEKWLKTQAFWERMRVPRSFLGTWAKYTGLMLPITITKHMFGAIGKGITAAQWSAVCAWEASKGAAQMVAAPPVMIGASRFRRFKQYIWDGGWSGLSALIRTPIRMALSPKEMVAGTRHAIKSLPKRAKGYVDAIFQGGNGLINSIYNKAKGIMGNTRDAIYDVIAPISRPAKYIAQPATQTLGVYANAELQTGSAMLASIEKSREGYQHILDSPKKASKWLATKNMAKDALKAFKNQLKEATAAAKRKRIEGILGRPIHAPMPTPA